MPLAEQQSALRDAIVTGNGDAVLPFLVGRPDGCSLAHRLSIHQRHYEIGLVDLIRRRFPALEWLVGEAYLQKAALSYARARPPRRPMLGEYGQDFPSHLAAARECEAMPWLAEVGALEWQLAEVAATVDQPPLGLEALAPFDAVPLEGLHVRLQGGARYSVFEWPVDVLVKLFLDKDAPPALTFDPSRILLELHGSRGAFSIRRIDQDAFAFRGALLTGASFATAIAAAETVSAEFDAGVAVAALFGDGLVAEVLVSEDAAT